MKKPSALSLRCSPLGRCRLIVFVVSFIGFATLACLLLIPEQSSVLLSRPLFSKKISVILFPPSLDPETLQRVVDQVIEGISRYQVEAEYLLVYSSPPLVSPDTRGSHMEQLEMKAGFTATVTNAFSRAHYSLLLVLAEVSKSALNVVPKLIDPVLNGRSDLAVAHSGTKSTFAGILAYPLLHSMTAVGNSSVFCFHKAVWVKGCKPITQDAPSITLELLAKCSVHSPVALDTTASNGHLSTGQLCLQVWRLYWQLHRWPLLLSLSALSVLCIFCVRTLRSGTNAQLYVV